MAKKSGTRTIFWWVVWIGLTIASFFIAYYIWTPIIAEKLGSVREPHIAAIWVGAVFGTWMLFLLPLIVVMYQKVDRAYEDARMTREKAAARFRSVKVDQAKRRIAPGLSAKIRSWPPTVEEGHLLKLTLKDGRTVPHVFVRDCEIVGLYDHTELPFEGADVSDAQLEDPREVAYSSANQWLRVDGVKPQD